ncbi:DUF4344 domain-containing metallopeptidase [Yoonia sp. MH D7]
MKAILVTAALIFGTAASADERSTFVEHTLLTVFYHELGHALIDLEGLPLYGPNEPSADIASVMIVERLYPPETSMQMITAAADLFAAEGVDRGEIEDFSDYADTHGSDQGRFFNTVCIYYGGDTEARQEWADMMELPDGRAERCADEYDVATKSWGVLLDRLSENAGRSSFVLGTVEEGAPLTVEVITAELEALNADIGLDYTLPVSIETCGEPNAYYDSETKSMTMCLEFEEFLGNMYDLLQ